MAQPPQQGPPVSLLMHPSSSVSGASTASNGGSPSMQATPNGRSLNSWDGDRMLHVYMIDYCRKRGFREVVNTLCQTTGNPADVKAPIDAPQGLLFEWWVVFWDIFTAKTEDDPKKNAVAYLQDQRAKNYRPMHPTDVKPPIGVQIPGHNFNGPHPPPSSGTLMGPGPFPGHPTGHPNQQPPGMQPMPTPNGLPPNQQQHPPRPPGAPTPVPPPSQHINGPQPYPPQQQTPQPPHPNPANGPQGPPPNQAPGVPNQMMANRPGGPTGPQMPIGAQRGGLPAGMQNGQGGHQPFSGSPLGPGGGPPNGGPQPSPRTSHMGPPHGVRPHPQQPGQHPQQQGGPANAHTPGSSGMVNGMGSNATVMAAQQFMNVARPGSRSGTPGSQAGGQPGISMSPSRTGGPPMQQSAAPARPGSQMGGPQQPGGQGSPFAGPMPGPAVFSTQLPPQIVEQAMRALGFHKPQESLTPEERSMLHMWLRNSMQSQNQAPGQRPPGMGTPRLPSGGNQMMQGASQPGQPGPQAGMPGPNFSQQQQLSQPQQMMGQPGPQMMKRPGSPSMQMDASTNENSPPDRKRLRKDSQNGSTSTGMPGFAPGAPAANGMPGQPPMPNGAGHPNMMRLPQGAPGNPGQAMNPMMVNGVPHNPGANPMPIRPPQQPGQRFLPGIQMQNKPGGLMNNPHAAGLPIPVKTEPGNMDPQQQAGNMGPRGPQPKVHPSPSIAHAKAGGSMPPPSHTPNPSQAANKANIKEEDGTAKSSPGTKPATQPPTPIPNPATPANAQNPNHIFNSTIAPSPSSILANQANMNQSTPPTNVSRPGSSANPQSTTAASTAGFFGGGDMYTDFSGMLDYAFGPPLSRQDDLTTLEDPSFDILSEFLNPSAVGMQDDDITATAGGSS